MKYFILKMFEWFVRVKNSIFPNLKIINIFQVLNFDTIKSNLKVYCPISEHVSIVVRT